MTAPQLWETTMDPIAALCFRSNWKISPSVKPSHHPYGEDVEARRKFIEDNASTSRTSTSDVYDNPLQLGAGIQRAPNPTVESPFSDVARISWPTISVRAERYSCS